MLVKGDGTFWIYSTGKTCLLDQSHVSSHFAEKVQDWAIEGSQDLIDVYLLSDLGKKGCGWAQGVHSRHVILYINLLACMWTDPKSGTNLTEL